MSISPRQTETPRPHDDYYLAWILKIAAGASAEASEATQAVYLERLRRLSATEMRTAGERTIAEWPEAHKMPPLQFILERTARPVEYRENRALLERPDKPDDTPPEERAAFARQLISELRSKITEGSNRAPTYRESCEFLARQRNQASQIPADPVERAEWASAMAKKRGWV